jgi:hypothetical protein
MHREGSRRLNALRLLFDQRSAVFPSVAHVLYQYSMQHQYRHFVIPMLSVAIFFYTMAIANFADDILADEMRRTDAV